MPTLGVLGPMRAMVLVGSISSSSFAVKQTLSTALSALTPGADLCRYRVHATLHVGMLVSGWMLMLRQVRRFKI